MGLYLIDNNIISGYFSENFESEAMNFISGIFDQIPNIFVITEIEALSWNNPNSQTEEIIKEFIKDANILQLTPKIVTECVKLKRSKKIKNPDAIIAGTALIQHLQLITSDKGFNHIKGLKVLDPFMI